MWIITHRKQWQILYLPKAAFIIKQGHFLCIHLIKGVWHFSHTIFIILQALYQTMLSCTVVGHDPAHQNGKTYIDLIHVHLCLELDNTCMLVPRFTKIFWACLSPIAPLLITGTIDLTITFLKQKYWLEMWYLWLETGREQRSPAAKSILPSHYHLTSTQPSYLLLIRHNFTLFRCYLNNVSSLGW